MTPSARLLLPAFGLLSALLAPPARANDDVELIQFLASSGADANGTCRVRWRDKGDSLDFNVEIDHMSSGDYELWVAGAPVHDGTFSVGALGEAELEYVNPKDGNKPLFDFEVLNQLVEVKQGATVFFSEVFDGSGSGGGGGGGSVGAGGKTEIFMVNVGPDHNAKGRLRFETKAGKLRFDIQVEDLDAGDYELLVAGVSVEPMSVTGAELELEFQDPVEPGKLLLDFDPLGAQLDVVLGGTVYLTAVMPAAGATGQGSSGKGGADDLGGNKGDKLLMPLASTGLVPGAHGKATLAQSGEVELEVEFEDVPDGSYDLLVGGLLVGSASTSAGAAQFHFSTSPGLGESLLDFPVQGQLIEVKNAEGTLLSVVFPISVQSALGTFKKEIHTAKRVKINLIGTGADLDTRGVLDFKDRVSHDTLSVAVVDLAPGEYDLVVDGTPVAGVLVVVKPDGKAKVVFDSLPKGKKLPLDFAVPGATVQVTPAGDAATVLLEGVVE